MMIKRGPVLLISTRARFGLIKNPVLFILATLGICAGLFGSFLNQAPNRLARGTALYVWQGPFVETALIALALVILAFAALRDNEAGVASAWLRWLSALLLLAIDLIDAGHFAWLLEAPAGPAARVSFGVAFWVLLAVAVFAILDTLQRAQATFVRSILVFTAIVLAAVAMAHVGLFDALSLAKEYAGHRAAFADEVLRHLLLVAAALVFALLVGVPLTLLALRYRQAHAAILQALNLLQTIPSIALFGLLIAPLTALAAHLPFLTRLGIGGTGAAPAIIALVLYALLPMVRGFTTGFAEIPAAVRDAARGLGFSGRQIFWRIDLPLALPALVSALRVVTVQAIGLAGVAALIGAGGLGVFVFQGIGQYALDLVLLGALPIIAMALVADAGFQLVLAALRRPA